MPKCLRPLIAIGSMLLISGCGGGHSVAQPTISATLTTQGTLITCTGTVDQDGELIATLADGSGNLTVPGCPGTFLAPQVKALATWTLQNKTSVWGVTSSKLPDPVVVVDGQDVVAVRQAALPVGTPHIELQALDASGAVLASFPDPTRIPAATLGALPLDTTTWRWHIAGTVGDYVSRAVAPIAPTRQADYPVWGALTVGDINGDGIQELLGTVTEPDGQAEFLGYTSLDLEILYQNPGFRDVRQVDLNGDGLPDIVSNVYGSGCVMIGLRRSASDYTHDWLTPTRADGSCISGHGETILVADFDGSGRPSIVLPSYERLDYLRNDGNGNFTEVADQIGLSFPNYLPTFEGAAAVDIDLNGTVDIVIGSEVLLNDGTGHFTRLAQPLGTDSVFQDEGISVVDADNDGIFDIIRLNPSLGALVFWGQSDRVHFVDDGHWILGGVLDFSDGIAAGDLTGNALPDLLVAGGETSAPAHLCVQSLPRQFTCMDNALPESGGGSQDLLMLTDLDGDGQAELVERDSVGMHRFGFTPRKQNRWQVDLRDAQGRMNQYGRSIRAVCALDGSLISLKFVDGGNGYMAQGAYAVPFQSDWCPAARFEVPTPGGLAVFGPYPPGAIQLLLNSPATVASPQAVRSANLPSK